MLKPVMDTPPFTIDELNEAKITLPRWQYNRMKFRYWKWQEKRREDDRKEYINSIHRANYNRKKERIKE